MSLSSYTHPIPSENGYTLCKCKCCPYGYHIDLDFVRYCDSINQEADRTGSIKRRKDRRRQRQSMEVLLGITPPVLAVLERKYKSIDEQQPPPRIAEKPKRLNLFGHDSFDDALTDFERMLMRSQDLLPPNLPDVTAVSDYIRRTSSHSSMSSTSASSMTVLPTATDRYCPPPHEFDTVSIDSCGLSPLALQNIREQMALSLERTKLLEEQVKLIPLLEDQVGKLEKENRSLLHKLKTEEISKLNAVNANYLNNRVRSNPLTFNNAQVRNKEAPPPPPRKDFGVMCGVLTRTVGVGHQNPNTKTVSTLTVNGNGDHADKWLREKEKFMNQVNAFKNSQATQTSLKFDGRDVGVQSAKPLINNASIQTNELIKSCRNVGVQNGVKLNDFAAQKTVDTTTIGCSSDTIRDVICEKCAVIKNSVAVGPDSNEDAHTAPLAISLAALSTVPRSKSFNLGADKLNLAYTKSRTVACQYEANTISRGTQCDAKRTHSKLTQHEIKLADKQTQFEVVSVTKQTDTKDLDGKKVVNVACEAKNEYCDVACNTSKDEGRKEQGSPTPSRIPRPAIPTTPVENRKFRRQDTYTKMYMVSSLEKLSPSDRLAGLDLSHSRTISNESSPLDTVKQNFKFPELPASSSAQNGSESPSPPPPITKVQIHETTLPVSETTLFPPAHSSHNRNKAVPSKEMQGAMKVLNDSLVKKKTIKNQSAVDIVQQEWFKISSLNTANPLDVEDYLDAFEDMSALLLQYIVNMSDSSGNTAMHYAVSHGNFDVVSILLDSKVCDINQPNKTGYTSVMLVSLTEVRSQTHAHVVRRLFQLADVNIRAKQHGQTALMLAVSHGRLDMVKMLLEAGADVNIQDEDGSTALMCAAEHGYVEIVQHFLSQPDCDSSITDVDGSTALKIAMEAGHRHIGVILYAHERNQQKSHQSKMKKKSVSPKTPSSPLPIRSSHRALTDTKTPK